MLKTVSSITNAIGALNYKGTWDANTNSPALASSVGTKGDYYVVGTAGTTNLNGISNWGVGDWAAFNGSVWQRVEGGADLNGVNLSVSGTATFANDSLVNGLTVGRGGSAVATNTALGASALTANTSGSGNTAIGSSSGSVITTGSKNTILGAYTGNSNGLDIRAKSNNVVLSDGDGNPTNTRYSAGNVSTTAVDIAPTNSATGGLHFVSGYNTADGAQGWWLIATRVNSVTTIDSSNNTGLTVTFGQTDSVRLNAVTSSGTINITCTTIS